jgi:lysophospholipase L1-like esterase
MTLKILHPWDIVEQDISDFAYRFLAEGDSWFSIGEVPPWATSNLLFAMQRQFRQSHVAINCARQGDTLSHMSQMWADANFTGLLDGNVQRPWDAILLSVGGNDLIDACLVAPSEAADKRLLLKPAERPVNITRGAQFISPTGWALFETYFNANMKEMIRRRDNSQSNTPVYKAPIFLHTYACPVIRNAPAGPMGPWLFKAMQLYEIDPALWPQVAAELFDRLRALLVSFDSTKDRVFVFDSARKVTQLVPAAAGSSGASGDWQNEIHLTAHGYLLVATELSAFIEAKVDKLQGK